MATQFSILHLCSLFGCVLAVCSVILLATQRSLRPAIGFTLLFAALLAYRITTYYSEEHCAGILNQRGDLGPYSGRHVRDVYLSGVHGWHRDGRCQRLILVRRSRNGVVLDLRRPTCLVSPSLACRNHTSDQYKFYNHF